VVLKSTGTVAVVPIRCRDRLCPLCAHRRAAEAAERFGRAVRAMGAARHIVLTVASIEAPLKDQLDELRRAMRRLRSQHRWSRLVDGGVYSIEITRNRQTGRWHPHVHVIADGDYYHQRDLTADWQMALRSGTLWSAVAKSQPPIVHISAVHNRNQLARYIAKYISKPADIASWPHDAIAQYASALRGVRMLHAFGSLHGVKLSGDEPNQTDPGATFLVGLGTLDYRAQQGYPAAERAVAILRRLVGVCSLWIGARRQDDLGEWANGLEQPEAELQSQLRELERQVNRGPPGTDARTDREKHRDQVKLQIASQLVMFQGPSSRG